MNSPTPQGDTPPGPRPSPLPAPVKLALSLFGLLTGVAVIGVLLVSFMMMMAYPNLPDIDSLATYQPKMPLRVFSADNMLIGELARNAAAWCATRTSPKS